MGFLVSTRRGFLQQLGGATLAALIGVGNEPVDEPLPYGMFYCEQLTIEPMQMPRCEIFFMELEYMPYRYIGVIDTLRDAFMSLMEGASV